MSVDTFGLGYIFARRTDTTIATTTPDYLGIAQSFDFSMKQQIKKLMGQFKVAVDVAGAELDITGKIKFSRLNIALFNDLLFGQTVTTGASAGKQISVVVNGLPEQHAAAATVTVTQAATFSEDLGVFYAVGGKQLTRVASSPPVASYSVNETTGVYTFNASETGNLNFFYEYTNTSSMTSVAVANTLMGTIPAFEFHYQHYYVNQAGTVNNFHLKLNACRGEGFDMPFKNNDFQAIDWKFTAFADTSGNIGNWEGAE